MPVAALLFAVVVWGLVPVALRELVLNGPTADVVIYRTLLSGLLAGLVLMWTGVPALTRAEWMRVLAASLIGNVGYQLLSIYGIEGTPASWTGVIYGLEPIFIALFAAVLAGERPGLPLYVGFALALAGTAVLFLSAGFDTTSIVSPFHLALVTASTMGWGFYTVVIAPVAARRGSLEVSLLSLVVSAVPAVAFMREGFFHRAAALGVEGILAVVFLAIFGSVLAVVFWNYGVAHMKKAVAGLFLYAQPLVAALAGWWVLGEPLGAYFFLGGALILAGLAVAQAPSLLRERSA
ncbi:MAG: DMT family transporter [Hyphomicrobiales bacterium]